MFIPLVIGLCILKQLDTNSRLIVLLIPFAATSQLAGYIFNGKSQVWLFYNIYSNLDSIFWGYLFFRNSRGRLLKMLIIALMLLAITISINMQINFGIQSRFISEFVCINSLLQVLWVLSFFYDKFHHGETSALENEPMFWYSLGLLVYAPTTYFLFVYFEQIRGTKNSSLTNLWSIHHFVNTLMYLSFAMGILTNIKHLKPFYVFRKPKS